METYTAFCDRTLEQRMTALERANEIRSYRAAAKRGVKSGRLSARELLLDTPAELEGMKVVDLLMAVPKVGKTKVSQMLVRGLVSPSKTIGGLTVRQRGELVAALGRRG